MIEIARKPELHGNPSRIAESHLAAAMQTLPKNSAPFAVLRIALAPLREGSLRCESSLDPVLFQQAQQRLQTSIREHEMAALLPGGELLVLLCSVRSVIRTGAAADRLAGLLQQPFCVQGRRLAAVASIGVAIAPDDGNSPDMLARRAAIALRQARLAGRGVVQFFAHSMEEGHHRPLSLHERRERWLQQWQTAHPTYVQSPGLSLAASRTAIHLV